ncbi:hypothetical protein M422DRAFT_190596, partial [Sphaerobolus stellatus SS14]
VENTYFKIPRHRLEGESEVFNDIFSLPVGTEGEGHSDDTPIRLEQVTLVDFERLITYLYPMTLNYETYTQTWGFEEWISILRLATRWMMENVRKKAIRRLCSLRFPNEIEKIRCGRDYRYPPWVREGILEIVQRESPVVTEVEGQYLGLRDALRCAAAREFYRPRK